MRIKLLLAAMCVLLFTGCVTFATDEEIKNLEIANVAQLYKVYDQNKLAANKQYAGQSIKVRGVVTKIEQMAMFGDKSYYVFLKDKSGKIIRCWFDDGFNINLSFSIAKASDEILTFKKGDTITVFGVIDDLVMDNTDLTDYPRLAKCRFVEGMERTSPIPGSK